MAPSDQRLQRFGRDKRGNVSIIFALTAIPVFGMVALAVDYGRAVNAKTQLQNATDSAALIAVRLTGGDEQARIEAAKKTFAANYRPYGQAQVAPSVVFDGGTVRVTATDYVPTSIAGLAGLSEFTVNAQIGATMLSGKKLELSMMIDLTGSMSQTRNGQTKLSGLKEAAADLLDILFPNDAVTSDSVRIAIAPFADYVNAGQWAPTATGLPDTGGTYANITNLGSTRQANFRGNYTGAIINSPGSQVCSTPVTTTYPGQITTAGTTYSNGYCAVSTVTTTVSIRQYNGRNTGESVSRDDPYYSSPYSGVAPTGMIKATSTARYYDINKYR